MLSLVSAIVQLCVKMRIAVADVVVKLIVGLNSLCPNVQQHSFDSLPASQAR